MRCLLVIPVLRSLMQEDGVFQANLRYEEVFVSKIRGGGEKKEKQTGKKRTTGRKELGMQVCW